ncbi:MAG: hypothetical protein KDK28_12480, partial [Maritimibacter sp.]|nr:hypothetical protein [Maritimibacter sp.]
HRATPARAGVQAGARPLPPGAGGAAWTLDRRILLTRIVRSRAEIEQGEDLGPNQEDLIPSII